MKLTCDVCARTVEAAKNQTGVVACGCGTIPVVDGIVVWSEQSQHDEPPPQYRPIDFEQLRSACRAEDAATARALLLASYPFVDGRRESFREYVHTEDSGRQSVHEYFKRRFDNDTYLGIQPVLGLLAQRGGPVIDAAAGMGHVAYQLSKVVDSSRLLAIDFNPSSVWAIRTYQAPEISLAIRSLYRPLPVPDGSTSAIVCCDAFQYLKDKNRAARDFTRTLDDDGLVLVLGIPNADNERIRAVPVGTWVGYPLSPDGYRALFPDLHTKVFPVSYFVDCVKRAAPLDLSRDFDPAELASSEQLMMIGARKPEVFASHPPTNDLVFERSTHFLPTAALADPSIRPSRREANTRELWERLVWRDVPPTY